MVYFTLFICYILLFITYYYISPRIPDLKQLLYREKNKIKNFFLFLFSPIYSNFCLGDLGFWEKPRQNRPKPQKNGLFPHLLAFSHPVLPEIMLSHSLGFWERLHLHLGETAFARKKKPGLSPRAMSCYLKWYVVVTRECALFV